MEDSTRPRWRCRRPALPLFGTLLIAAAAAGCGGLASSPALDEPEAIVTEPGDTEASEPEPSEPEPSEPEPSEPEPSGDVPDEAAEEVPPVFDVLEVQQAYAVPATGANSCEYAKRIKVNMVLGMVITQSCTNSPDGAGSGSARGTSTLTATQRAAVERAYLQVQASNRGRGTSRDVLTLALEVGRANTRQNLFFTDDDHASCPSSFPSLPIVSGLPELYAELAQLFL